VGNTGLKRKSTYAHKSLVEVIERGNVALVQSINRIHEANLQIEKKHVQTQEEMLQKQLEYFKFQDTKINKTQEGMVRAIIGFT
jgi:hypothetical protein